MMACRIAPSSYLLNGGSQERVFDPSSSPDASLGADAKPPTGSEVTLRSSVNSVSKVAQSQATPTGLIRHAVTLIKSETTDIRSAAIVGLSFVNSTALRDLTEELTPIIRDAIDRKPENMRRKKRRDFLRCQLGRLFQLLVSRGVFGKCSWMIDKTTGSLHVSLLEYLECMRMCLELESDKELAPPLFETKQTFCDFISQLIQSFAVESRQDLIKSKDATEGLFSIFTSWTGTFSKSLNHENARLNDDLSPDNFEYSTRSLQILRTLKMPLNSRTIADILSRLIETISEQGEDMQAYVNELMLTLESAVTCLDRSDSTDDGKRCRSTPILNEPGSRKSAPPSLLMQLESRVQFNPGRTIHPRDVVARHHMRSTSVSFGEKEKKLTSGGDDSGNCSTGGIFRCKSVESLREEEMLNLEDKETLLAKFFWIAVAVLESDYEHEFILAIRLLENVLERIPLDRQESREKVEKIYYQLGWNDHFLGLHSMLLKGCTSANSYEPAITLLHRLTPLLEVPLIDPTESASAFPFSVMALMPHMLSNYDDPTPLCISAAESFASWSTEKSSRSLENLATVMTLYSRKAFSKETFQWTKCVVKYLYDAYSNVFPRILSFLVEVAEGGPPNIVSHVLSILYCILHYIDVTSSSSSMNGDLAKLISKYMESSQYKEALKLIKIVVSRSSSLAAPPTNLTSFNSMTMGSSYITSSSVDCVSITSTASFADSEVSSRRELPGRTMEFTFDLNQTPIVADKFLEISDEVAVFEKEDPRELSASPKKSLSHQPSFNESSGPMTSGVNWRKSCFSQTRIRERLAALLSTFGQRVERLPKSPSVIVSQTSEIPDKSSLASSTEDVSTGNNEVSNESKNEEIEGASEFAAFKDFDFLEYELESQDSEGMDNFNWGVRRRSLSNLDVEVVEDVYSCSPLFMNEDLSLSYETETERNSHSLNTSLVEARQARVSNQRRRREEQQQEDYPDEKTSSDEEGTSVSPYDPNDTSHAMAASTTTITASGVSSSQDNHLSHHRKGHRHLPSGSSSLTAVDTNLRASSGLSSNSTPSQSEGDLTRSNTSLSTSPQ